MALGKGLNSLIPQQKTRKKIRRESSFSAGDNNKIWKIAIEEIVANSSQPRKNFSHGDLEDLVLSIKKHGILQPLIVTENPDGGYELIAGERRLRASQIAGLAEVPIIIRSATEQEKLELALIENIQRQDLNPIEEAVAYARLVNEFNLTQEQVSEQMGKSRSTIANILRLLNLPDQIQEALIEGKITTGKAKALLGLKTEKEQLEVFSDMIGTRMSVRDLERDINRNHKKSKKGMTRRDPNLLAQEEILEDRFGTKVQITQKGEKGKIIIEYNSLEELKKILRELA